MKFLLAFVCKVMGEAVKIMDTPGKMKHIVELLWIVQLWLNVILATHITSGRDIPNNLNLKIKGACFMVKTCSEKMIREC